MKKDNKILSALLDHLIGEAEGGECDEISKWGEKDDGDDESDGNDTDVVNDEGNSDEDDEHAKKMKKFMSMLKD